MADKLLYKILITGQVQGVGFRWSAAREAGKHGITGFVKNLSDGSVYIEAEGSIDQLNHFVESVNINCSPSVNYTDFRIK